MEQNIIKTQLLAGVITLTANIFAGCTEYAEDPAGFTTEKIVINYTDSVVDASISSGSITRSVPESTEIGSSVLTSKTGKKMYLSCTEEPWPLEKTAVTRGAKVTTAGISNIGVSASVYPAANTYTSAGCGSYFYKELISSGIPMTYYWPASNYKISFFGYYPYNNAAFTVQSASNVTGAPTYAYTVPSAISSQQDIMTGQVTDRLGGSVSAVNMTLSHRCAAISFSITNDRSEAITVNSISIEGVKYTGTLNEDSWTLDDAVNSSLSNPFTLTCGSSIATGTTVDVTGTTNIFLMLPQTLPATAKLKMVVDDEVFESVLTGTWQAERGYTYSVTINENAIDLSMVDNAGNARASMTTANCYLVHAAGHYKLPLVYGNAIKNGKNNTTAYNPTGTSSNTFLKPFVNHAGTGITGPWITKSTSGSGVNKGMGLTAASAELLWQDETGLITEVGVEGDYLKFTVGGSGNPVYANAVIAVKDNLGTILWSWHIWYTKGDALGTTTKVATGSHNYYAATITLGYGRGGPCYYQWGRKDPFVSSQGYNSSGEDVPYRNRQSYDIDNNNISNITYLATSWDYKYTIQRPTTFSYDSSTKGPANKSHLNLWDAQNSSSSTANVTTATKKTIYDPCPPGFCVPTSNLYYYIGDGGNRSMTSWDDSRKQAIWASNTYFAATGYRSSNNSNIILAGTQGNYWSATPIGTIGGKSLMFDRNIWTFGGGYRAEGFSILPVKEE